MIPNCEWFKSMLSFQGAGQRYCKHWKRFWIWLIVTSGCHKELIHLHCCPTVNIVCGINLLTSLPSFICGPSDCIRWFLNCEWFKSMLSFQGAGRRYCKHWKWFWIWLIVTWGCHKELIHLHCCHTDGIVCGINLLTSLLSLICGPSDCIRWFITVSGSSPCSLFRGLGDAIANTENGFGFDWLSLGAVIRNLSTYIAVLRSTLFVE
jgi:hypothetical protein